MSDKGQNIIIIKRVIKKKAAHHSGSWKIAYADFVTAMMAFFMLLWLLSLLDNKQIEAISKYFKKPLSDVFVKDGGESKFKGKSKDSSVPIEKKDEGKDTSSGANQSAKAGSEDGLKKGSKADLEQAKALVQEKARRELEAIKHDLESSWRNDINAKDVKDHLDFSIVHDGVKVSLHDSENKQMFSLGKADFQNYAKNMIKWLSSEFNRLPKKIIIVGHTDTHKYDEKANYTNWELSTDRANIVRHLLVTQGMDPGKIIRVEGSADVSLFDKKNGDSFLNRRVEIIVLTDEAAQRVINQ